MSCSYIRRAITNGVSRLLRALRNRSFWRLYYVCGCWEHLFLGFRMAAGPMRNFFVQPLLVISDFSYRWLSLGTLAFPEAELGVHFLAGHGQKEMTVALAQATVARFSLYSSNKTWYSPCKGHRQSVRHLIHNTINHLIHTASFFSIQGQHHT